MSAVDDVRKIHAHYGGRPTTRGNQLTKCPHHKGGQEDRASFTYKASDDGAKLLLKCFVGCEFEDLLETMISEGVLDVAAREYAAKSKDNIWNNFEHPLVGRFGAEFDSLDYKLKRLHPYYDLNDKGEKFLRGFRCRFEPKDFRHFLHQSYNSNKPRKDPECPPYRYPELLDALRDGETIHITEGEFDADNIVRANIGEATSFGSSNDPLPVTHFPKFKDANCIIWGDNDTAGQKRASIVALALFNHGANVKVIFPPKGKDITDWLETGVENSEVWDLCIAAPSWVPEAETMKAKAKEGTFPITEYDIGSEAFAGALYAHTYCRELKYCTDTKTFMAYNSMYWEPDDRIYVEKAKQLSSVIKKAAGGVPAEQQKSLLKLANKAQEESGKRAIIAMAKTEDALKVDASQFNAKNTKYLLSCDSGVIDMLRGDIREFSPDFWITKHLHMRCDMDREPDWFLRTIFAMFKGDEEVSDYFLNTLALPLTGDTSLQQYWYWHGIPGSGKSQVQTVMRGLLGPFCCDIDPTSLVANSVRSAAIDSDLSDLRDVRLGFVSEVSPDYALDERIINAITGGDPLKVKRMNSDKFPLKADAKLIMTSNYDVKFRAPKGIARRVVQIRFEKSFFGDKDRVADLGEKLLETEGPQILGYLAKRATKIIQSKNLLMKEPQKVKNWSQDYLALLQFTETQRERRAW